MLEWAEEELREIRNDVWYPAVCAMLRDYRSGYTTSIDVFSKRRRLERTGEALSLLAQAGSVHYLTLRRYYRDGKKVGWHARRAALDSFCRAVEAI